ncbi:insulinase family protein [Patescibacteria group bacterium]|nr:insulinase family protein [Patescibacteria group bacterium]MBU1682366.1 insulinase family protein [Patescibacteria group bacterium]MBU1934842.1 insulinase family protein [Patescibacteria group bacterium]
MHKLITQENGLKIILSPIEGTKSCTVLCLVGAGSRFENKEINGISHFLEHMFFKGAKKYRNAAEVASAIDSVGGDFNAFTGKEYAGYFVKLASHQKEVAFDVIGDMMINATFLPEEIEKERGVILEEYNMYQDTPMYQVGWDFERLLFGDQPMGWDQIGTKEIIKNLTREQFQDYKNSLYTPDNTVISISGDFDEAEVMDLVKKYFAFEDEKRARHFEEYKKIEADKKIISQHKKTEQGHVIIGVEGMSYLDDEIWTEKILSVILGGNMSSRMFMNVREAKGLCYYIRTTTDDYTDTGAISTSAGVDLSRVDMAITAILEEYRKIMESPVDADELNKAKEFMKGKIILRLEDSEEYAHLMGKQALLYPEIDSVDEILKKIDAVTAESVQKLSQKLFAEENLRLAMIGPFKNDKHFAGLLHY